MKVTKGTMKAYIGKWNKMLEEAYNIEFDKNVQNGFYGATDKMISISVIKGLMDRAINGGYGVWFETDEDGKYTGKMVIADITGLYELGDRFTKSMVQSVLRGLNSTDRDLVYTCICLALNSAEIADIKALVNRLAA